MQDHEHDASTLGACDLVFDSPPLQSCVPDSAGMSSFCKHYYNLPACNIVQTVPAVFLH